MSNNILKRYLVRNSIALPVVGFLVVCAGLFAVLGDRQNVSTIVKQSVTHQAEPATELYYTDPAKVPLVYDMSQPTPVTFTIHNLEDKDMTYAYEVFVGDTPAGDAALKLVSVKNGASVTITEIVPAADYGAKAKFTIALVDQQQSIHFWVERL